MLTLIFVFGMELGGFGEGFGKVAEWVWKDFGRVWGLAECKLILILPNRRFRQYHRFS